jgi:hypothetical protein
LTPEQVDVLISRILKRAAGSMKGSRPIPTNGKSGLRRADLSLLYYHVMHEGSDTPD